MKKDQHRFEVGLITGGQYAAVSLTNPYFCFIGETQEEVTKTAHEALNFYFDVPGRLEASDKIIGPIGSVSNSTFRTLETHLGD